MTTQPVRDRSTARELIRHQLDQQAREHGYTDHAAEVEADYQAWRERAGLA